MEMERIALSQRERDRLKVLREVEQRHLTQLQATQRLQLTDRQVRRLLLRSTRAEMVHWFTDSAADHRTASWRPPWSRRFWRGYASGTLTLAPRWLRCTWRGKGCWSQRVKVIHVWRGRRASFGELVMQDSSPGGTRSSTHRATGSGDRRSGEVDTAVDARGD